MRRRRGEVEVLKEEKKASGEERRGGIRRLRCSRRRRRRRVLNQKFKSGILEGNCEHLIIHKEGDGSCGRRNVDSCDPGLTLNLLIVLSSKVFE